MRRIIGTFNAPNGQIVALNSDGTFVRRADTDTVVCHLANWRKLAELSPRLQESDIEQKSPQK